MPSDAEDQPQAYNAKGLAPARKRRLSTPESSRPAKRPLPDETQDDQPQAYNAKGLPPTRKRRLSTPESSRPAKRPLPDETQDDLPQAYNAKDLAPARKRAVSPSEQPRKQKRPGQRARITQEEREAIRARQREREREAEERERQVEKERSAINDVVRAHYNAVPERGRDWRRTDSNIKGLRAFNNWVKSCIIQKYSPNEDYAPGTRAGGYTADDELLVLDMGCGKGGDLQKWTNAPQPVALYVGLDSADVSIDQARERYRNMGSRGGRGGRYGRPPRMDARFFVKDCFTSSLEDVEIVRQVGFDPTGHALGPKRGFDVVSMMFCMHYAFETEEKARTMLRNVAGALKKGGRFIGTIPNSDVISERVREFNAKEKAKKAKKAEMEAAAANGKQGEEDEKKEIEEGEEKEEGEADEDEEEGEAERTAEWGNKIYRVRFPGETPEDGVFRPPYGWKYNFFLDEAVEEVPEYVVPWGIFRGLAEHFNLEMQYYAPFREVWNTMKDDRELGILSERMGVRERGGGKLLVSPEEMEAADFYLAFCFYKV